MRHLAIILMLALLPLRGWMGDAMAMEMTSAMLSQPTGAIESGAGYTHAPRVNAGFDSASSAHADCPEHAVAQDDQDHAGSDCDACSACQICHSVALTPVLPVLAPLPQSAARPQVSSHPFASAERASGFKPPIS